MNHRSVVIISLIFLLLLNCLTGFSQKGYDIKLTFSQNSDTLYYLARYQSGKVYMVDTSAQAEVGKAIFKGDAMLKPGVYILASAEKVRLLEFIVDQDQVFDVSIDDRSDQISYKVNGSKENELFLNSLTMNAAIGKTHGRIEQLKQDDTTTENPEALQSKLDSLNREVKKFREHVIKDYPETLLSKIFLAMTEVEVPDSIRHIQPDAYMHYRSHYWNHVDLSDERLLATPLLTRMLQTFFEQVLPQIADSIIPEIDMLISKSSENLKVRDFLIWHFTSAYQNPKIMGLDKVFVHMADTYFAKMPVSDTSEDVLQRILKRADQLRNLIIGAQAPELILVDTNNHFVSFRTIEERFTVLFFWDHTCGFCKQDLNKLKELYESGNYELEVFAIGTNGEIDKWKEYIRKEQLNWINVNGTRSVSPNFHDLYDIYSTPVIYLLDADKTIIAKRIDVSQLEMILEDRHK